MSRNINSQVHYFISNYGNGFYTLNLDTPYYMVRDTCT